jgi:hypothetical protein
MLASTGSHSKVSLYFSTITNDQTNNVYQSLLNHTICLLATAVAAWEDLQPKSCAGIMNNLTLILLFTFSPSRMIKQTMLISPFADICKIQGPTSYIYYTQFACKQQQHGKTFNLNPAQAS